MTPPSLPNSTTSSFPHCFKPMPAVSNGILQGDLPLDFSLPLLTIQIAVVLLVTRSMAMLFKPLRQPRVLAEIIGGVLLGPTALGRNKHFKQKIFPEQSLPLLDTVATMGLMFFIFMVGLELDLQALRKTGRKALMIGFAGIAVPFAAGAGLASLVRSTISQGVRLGPLIVFMGVPLSISAFSVLVRIMAELKLLTTDLGKIAVPAAAINDVTVWMLLAVGVAIAGPESSPLTPVWVVLCGLAFGICMFTLIRILMTWVARRATRNEPGTDIYICITLMGVLLAGLVSDAIGVHPLFGPFLFGLVIPNDSNFPKMVTEKIEDFVTGLMLPLFFASSGLKTNLGTLHGVISLGFLVLFFATAAIGKISATFVFGKISGLPTRSALILGFLMNTKGLAVLIVLNIGKDLKALTDETFAILVLTCLLTSFVTTPVVTALCLPSRISKSYSHCNVESVGRKHQLRILACAHDSRNYAAIVNLVEASRGSKKSLLKLYILRLIELSERPSAILMLNSSKENGLRTEADGFVVAFQASGKLSKVPVRPLTAISGFNNMHEDICKIAIEKRATIIILPSHKYWHRAAGMFEAVHPGHRTVNQEVLECAPCSVGILVDRGWEGASPIHPYFFSYKVAVLFFGGPDDREALVLGCRMAEHPGVELKVVRFLAGSETGSLQPATSPIKVQAASRDQFPAEDIESYQLPSDALDAAKERSLDEQSLAMLKDADSFVYEEDTAQNPIDAIKALTKTNDINLFLVGRGRYPRPQLDNLLEQTAECSELGVVGDLLASSGPELKASILVVQQHLEESEMFPSKGSFRATSPSSSFGSLSAV